MNIRRPLSRQRIRSAAAIVAAAAGALVALTAPAAAQSVADAQLISEGGPGERALHAMAYDSARGVTVLWGGSRYDEQASSYIHFGDTWEWDGIAWTKVAEAGPPAGVGSSAMAYDSARGVCVLWRRISPTGEPRRNQTWEWDGVEWTLVDDASTPTIAGGVMAYDSARGMCVLFRGAAVSWDGETWEWDGASWTLAHVVPQGRDAEIFGSAHDIAYDAGRARTVLYKNFSGDTQTWEWDGADWTLMSRVGPDLAGLGSGSSKMAYDAGRGATVIFAAPSSGPGSTTGHPLWEWDGAGWAPVVGDLPPTREQSGLVYDSARGKLILHGGRIWIDTMTWINFGDTWEMAITDGFRLPILQGQCPGPTRAVAKGATPFGTVRFYIGSSEGATALKGNPCSGATLPLSGGVKLLGSAQADANGNATFNFTAARGNCGRQLAALDVSTCTTTNAALAADNLPLPESAGGYCPADCDGSGSLDTFDFLCFQNLFAAGDAAADCDGSGGLDIFDFLCFQNAFAAGCP